MPTAVSERDVVRIRLMALALAALCGAAHAADDAEVDFEAARANTKEVAHEVIVDVRESGVATFTVTRTFAALSPASPINIHRTFYSPPGVVTSFAVQTGGRWRQGALRRDSPARPEEGAPRVFREGEPWASLDLQDGVEPEFETTAFRAAGPVQVRYTVWAKGEPTKEGHRWEYCPREHKTDEVAPLKVLPAAPDTPIEIRARSDSPSCIEILSREPPRTKLSARYGVYRLGPKAWAWRVELVAPESLGAGMGLPEGSPIVFVLDASRSQERNGGLATQLEIVGAFLKNAPKARVELVRVERNAQRVFGRFIPAGDFARSVPAGFAQGPLGNGSFLDRGAAVATELLVQERGPGRVVLFSDGALRSAFSRAGVIATLRRAPRGTTVHVVSPYKGGTRGASVQHITPSDDLGEIAVALGGADYGVTVGVDPVLGPSSLVEGVRRLLWPDQIESIALSTRGGRYPPEWPGFDRSRRGDWNVSGELKGGEEVSWSGVADRRPPSSLRLTGWVWGKKLEFFLKPDPVMQRQLPRLVTSDRLVMTCDWSPRHEEAAIRDGFLAPGAIFWIGGAGPVEPYRTASPLYDPCMGGFSGGGGIAETVKRDELPREIDLVVRACGLPPGGVRAKIETIDSEIVDVAVAGGDAAQRDCASAALWGFRLPDKFNDLKFGRRTYDVVLSPAVGGAGGSSGAGGAGGAGGGDSGRRQR
jgi:hypothetical protein